MSLAYDVSLKEIAMKTGSFVARDLESLVGHAMSSALGRLETRIQSEHFSADDLAPIGVCVQGENNPLAAECVL
jgi:SpoVK/Ycf46/Vps4 family AAA+-type ATPase